MRWKEDENRFIYDNGIPYNKYILHDFEIIIVNLSILTWKLYNGPIELYTNEEGLQIFKDLKLDHLYDKIDITLIEEQKKKYNIDETLFWAAHKLMVMSKLKTPFTILDLDLFVERKLEDMGFFDNDIGLFHFETHGITYMPFPPNIKGYNKVDWPENWDWDSYPVNVALLYFGNQDALDMYTKIALEYMHNNNEPSIYDVYKTRMVFAEQRILGELVDKTDFTTTAIMSGLFAARSYEISDNVIGFIGVKNLKSAIFIETIGGFHKHSNIKLIEQHFNHLWGYKAALINQDNFSDRLLFVSRLLDKVKRDYPSEYDRIRNSLDVWYEANI